MRITILDSGPDGLISELPTLETASAINQRPVLAAGSAVRRPLSARHIPCEARRFMPHTAIP